MIAWWFALVVVHAGSSRVVQQGDTVESIAAELGDPTLASAIRSRNRLGPDAQPAIGRLLDLPVVEEATCEPSYVLSHFGEGYLRLPGVPGTRPLTDLEPLPLGATVCTGPGSFARVRVAVSFDAGKHDAIVLMPESCVTLRTAYHFGGSRASLLDLSKGQVAVEQEEDRGAVIVQTGSGVAVGERGGFRVAIESGATRTEAFAEKVATLAAGRQVDLAAGTGNRMRRGQGPGDPVSLPRPGEPLSPLDGARLDVPDFRWVPADEALGYFVEIGRSPGFGDLVARHPVASATWEPTYLFLPYQQAGLWWRIVSYDVAGFEGAPSSSRRFEVPPEMAP